MMERLVLCLVTMVLSMDVLGAATGVFKPPPAMYVFGDSTLDVGNNNYLPGANVRRANRPYYGVDFPGGVPTGRFSNGYNTADFIAKCIGLVSSPPPYLSLVAPASSGGLLVPTAVTIGVSYASGAAGILDSTNAGSTIPLSKQVQYFNATRSNSNIAAAAGSSDAVDTLINRSFFLILIGGNDVFAFANAEQAGNRSDNLGLMADTFAHPRASGFTDVADACCGGGRLGAEAACAPNATLCADRGQYYFWDNIHPTEQAAALRAQAFYDGPAQYTTPINFKQLVRMS